jgi:hypothetical protein
MDDASIFDSAGAAGEILRLHPKAKQEMKPASSDGCE